MRGECNENNELMPQIRDCNREARFPSSAIPKIAELGLLGCNLEGYGLPGMDPISYGLVMKELERCDSGVRSFCSVQGSLVMYPIHAYGTELSATEVAKIIWNREEWREHVDAHCEQLLQEQNSFVAYIIDLEATLLAVVGDIEADLEGVGTKEVPEDK